MPSFIKDLSLRRRSKSSFKVAEVEVPSSENTSLSNEGNDKPLSQRNKSSSTLSSFFEKASPPLNTTSTTNLPSTEQGHYGPTPPPVPGNRPRLASAQGKRYSLVGSTILDNEGRQASATSAWAPRVLSVSDGSWVHQKILLISGQCADPQAPIDGTISIYHHQDNFPMQQWPVNDSHFKALVHLQPGPNRLRLDFTSPRLHTPGGTAVHTSWININYLPYTSTPPVQLCILLGSDSTGTYDATPERIAKEGNDLAVAIRKFRMSAYLWQAFTAEQMSRNNLGRRCYRYEEEWQQGTLSLRDFESGQMRNEAKVHVIRMDKTVAEIRDMEVAQQNPNAQRSGDLYGWAGEAVRKYFNTAPGQVQYVSCLYLDTHWDKDANTLRGHAALGGGDDTVKLAIFGSHCIQSYPAHLEEVIPAFNDCTRTDTNYVANDCGDAGSSWEAVNIGVGAHLHETGHLLGCPHQESGIMLRDYVTLHRTFLTRESFSTRTKLPGQKLVRTEDECAWHRLDTLRFRYHPCFGIPNDVTPRQAGGIQVWGVDNASVLITCTSGIGWIELFPEGDGECHHWIEYSDHASPVVNAPRQITLTERDIKEHLPDDKRGKKLRIDIFSCTGERHEVNDVGSLMIKNAQSKLPDGRPAFKSSKLGSSAMEGTHPEEIILSTAWKQKEPLLAVRVYHGAALDGLEFFYEGGKSHLFGKRGGKQGGDEFAIDFRKGETILGFYVRAGYYIDGIQILTTTGRRSELYGSNGGSGHTLIPPRGYSIAGIYGTCGPWVDGFGLIITR